LDFSPASRPPLQLNAVAMAHGRRWFDLSALCAGSQSVLGAAVCAGRGIPGMIGP
jgi:hypothetical protein